MQEEEEEFFQIQGGISYDYYFIYKDKEYPFNYDFFKSYSKYFKEHQTEIEHDKGIPLIDKQYEGYIQITDKIIDTFIKYVQRERICITKENVSILNYLENKYKIDLLTEITEKYIQKHQNNLVIDLLLIHQNDETFETEMYERILSNHLLEHINDSRLLDLNFPILYRILEEYSVKEIDQNDIIEFCFKCLDKFGRKASILFKNVDFQHSKTEYLDLLTTKYSNIFDFHFINSEYMKTIYENQNKFYLELKESEKKNEELKQKFEQLKSYFEEQDKSMKDEIKQLKILFKEQNKLIKEELEQIKAKYNENEEKMQREIEELKEKNIKIEKLFEYQKEVTKSFFYGTYSNIQIDTFNCMEPNIKVLFFKELVSDQQIFLIDEMKPESRYFIFNQLELKKQLEIFKKFNKAIQLSIFNQMENKKDFFAQLDVEGRISILNLLEQKEQINLFNQLENEQQLNLIKNQNSILHLSLFNIIMNKLDLSSQISLLNQFENEKQRLLFNQLEGPTQVSLFHKANFYNFIVQNQIDDLLDYLARQYEICKQTSNNNNPSFIFIPSIKNQIACQNAKQNKYPNVIIHWDMVKFMYENKKLNITEIRNDLSSFNEIYFAIQYPSQQHHI